ncbi:MAG: hypothetical protein ACOX86_01060 [Pelotomaculaceae bacterium]|uniref:Uncharacterized protein n=1 Tax=anaerobic digester metagenome TaxID=1263854 RepID=A0A485LUH7_9ZZZZ|nr:hypothetical protein [Bacillota bacterium]HHU87498.1 hypothetical protein [Peptococcaceae bacterium]
MRDYNVIAQITEYLIVVRYNAKDNLFGLLFAPDVPGTAQTYEFEAKNTDDAIFQGVMMAKEKGFI